MPFLGWQHELYGWGCPSSSMLAKEGGVQSASFDPSEWWRSTRGPRGRGSGCWGDRHRWPEWQRVCRRSDPESDVASRRRRGDAGLGPDRDIDTEALLAVMAKTQTAIPAGSRTHIWRIPGFGDADHVPADLAHFT